VRLDSKSGLLAVSLASLGRCLLLGGGLPSTGLRLLLPPPHLTSVALLEREANIRLWCRHPRWNYHRGLSNRSILHPWCGCDKSELSPHAASPRRGEAEAPLPAWRHEELLDGVLYHGPPRGWCPTASWAHDGGAWVTPPGGATQVAEVVNDELEVLKVNGFTKGESTACQTFTVDINGDHRWGNHRNTYMKSMPQISPFLGTNCRCFLHQKE
jgi:hypothetical protein